MNEKLREMISKLIEEVEGKIIRWDEEEEEYVCNYCNQTDGIECMIVHKHNCISSLIDEICEQLENESNKVQIEIPKHETVENICNKILKTQTVVTILPNCIGNQPYSRAVIFPEEVKLQYDRFIATHHGKPEV